MTPHILLLTARSGIPYLLTIQSLATIEPMEVGGCFIVLLTGDKLECNESLDDVVKALGGLVLKPPRGPVKVPAFE